MGIRQFASGNHFSVNLRNDVLAASTIVLLPSWSQIRINSITEDLSKDGRKFSNFCGQILVLSVHSVLTTEAPKSSSKKLIRI